MLSANKFVPDTHSKTFVWSMNATNELTNLRAPDKHKDGHCRLCGAGPFMNERDKSIHEQSKRHKLLASYEQEWRDYLAETEGNR